MSELAVVSFVQSLFARSPIGIALAVFLARWLVFSYVIFYAWLWKNRHPRVRHAISHAAWSLILALVLVALIAFMVQRPRPFLTPFDAGHPVTLLISPPLHTSFPSGHTAASVALAAAIFAVHRRLGIAAFVVAGLVALGRVAVGVHYPTDLLGGLIVGLVSFWLVSFGHAQLKKFVRPTAI